MKHTEAGPNCKWLASRHTRFSVALHALAYPTSDCRPGERYIPVLGGGTVPRPDPIEAPRLPQPPSASGYTPVRDPASGIPVRTDLGAV